MKSNQNHQSLTQSGDPFVGLMSRMLGNWPISDKGIIAAKSEELRRVLAKVGEKRFRKAVDEVITQHATGFFPTVAEFMHYVPEAGSSNPLHSQHWEHTDEEWAVIRAEQATPEFQQEWDAWMKRCGITPAPHPSDLGKIMTSGPYRERK